MKAKINSNANFSQLVNACKINPCVCGHNAIFQKSPCGGIHIACTHCNNRSYECAPDMSPSSIERLRMGWNEQLIHLPWSKNLMEIQGANVGSIVIVRSEDSVVVDIHEYIEDSLLFIKNQCKRDFTVDYDLYQLVPTQPFLPINKSAAQLRHISSSKILCFVGGFEGFSFDKMQAIE